MATVLLSNGKIGYAPPLAVEDARSNARETRP